MNNAFPLEEAGGKETHGSLMGLMGLGYPVEGGPTQVPTSRATSKGGCWEVVCVMLEWLLLLSGILKPLLEFKIGCVFSLFLKQNSIVVKTVCSHEFVKTY